MLIARAPAIATAAAPDEQSAGWDKLSVVIDSVYVMDTALRVDFHADSAVTGKLLEGLRRGLTASISYQVRLWQKRFISRLVAERRFQYKAAFDHWEQKYLVVSSDERRMTSSSATVRTKWSVHRGLWIADLEQLQPGRTYYLVIEAFLEPVSKENLREIRGWLAGEVKGKTASHADSLADSTEQRSSFKMRFFETLMDLIGFGGKKSSVQSAGFEMQERVIVWHP